MPLDNTSDGPGKDGFEKILVLAHSNFKLSVEVHQRIAARSQGESKALASSL